MIQCTSQTYIVTICSQSFEGITAYLLIICFKHVCILISLLADSFCNLAEHCKCLFYFADYSKILQMHSFACQINFLFLTLKVLFWLPHKLPKGTILIVSANSSQSEILEELVSKRSFIKMEIQEMSEEMRQEFAKVCKSTSIQN